MYTERPEDIQIRWPNKYVRSQRLLSCHSQDIATSTVNLRRKVLHEPEWCFSWTQVIPLFIATYTFVINTILVFCFFAHLRCNTFLPPLQALHFAVRESFLWRFLHRCTTWTTPWNDVTISYERGIYTQILDSKPTLYTWYLQYIHTYNLCT